MAGSSDNRVGELCGNPHAGVIDPWNEDGAFDFQTRKRALRVGQTTGGVGDHSFFTREEEADRRPEPSPWMP